MKLTIETIDIKEAMAILTNLDATEVKAATEAPAHEAPAKQEPAAPAKPVAEAPAKPAHEDEVANKRSEAAKKAAATKKAKAEAEAKKAEAKKAEADADLLAGLEDEEVTMEMVQGALRAALKADKENKIAIREYFQKHGIVGGVDAIPENLFNDCYEFAQGLM